MKYHLNIIDGNVELPVKLQGEYEDLNEAYHDLFDFVHSFDEGKDVCGRIVDEDGEDVDYCNSIPDFSYDVFMDGESADGFDNLEDAINCANYLYGKGYSDDVTIWDNKKDEEVEW